MTPTTPELLREIAEECLQNLRNDAAQNNTEGRRHIWPFILILEGCVEVLSRHPSPAGEDKAERDESFGVMPRSERLSRDAAERGGEDTPFQDRVTEWGVACFGEAIYQDRTERNHRFLEEALELVQALGCTKAEAHELVDYSFSRPKGEAVQEVGGALLTLAALCNANGIDMDARGKLELARVW